MKIIKNLFAAAICFFLAYHVKELWADIVEEKGSPCTQSKYIPPLGPGVFSDILDGAHCTAVALCNYPKDTQAIIYISIFSDLGCPTDQVYNTVTVTGVAGSVGFTGAAAATDMSNLLIRGSGSAWTYCTGGSGTYSTDYPDVCGKSPSCKVVK